MTVNRASFRASFPEFDPASDAMVDDAIAQAIRGVDATVFGDATDDAVGWKAAHLLDIRAFGQSGRLSSDEGATTYGAQFDALVKIHASGFRLI